MAWLIHSQAFGSSSYPQQDTNAHYLWIRTSPYLDNPQLPAQSGGDESLGRIYLEQNDPTVDGTYFGNLVQHWPRESNCDPGVYSTGVKLPPDFEETRQPHCAIMEPRALFGHALATPVHLHRIDLAELPLMETDNTGTENPNKRKRDAAPGQRKQIERTKKPCCSGAQECIPVGTPEVSALGSKS